MITPEQRKRYRDRANRNMRALLKEKKTHGYFDDSAGKRYGVGVLFILAGENEKALEYYSWFESLFPDDCGEPIFNLYWALAEYRNGNKANASYRLKVAMLSNLYMLPFLFDEPVGTLDMWHSSNWDQKDYLRGVEEYLKEPSEEEKQWFKREYTSFAFTRLREEYIQTFNPGTQYLFPK